MFVVFLNFNPPTFTSFKTLSIYTLLLFLWCVSVVISKIHLLLICLCSQRRKFLRMKRQKYGYIYRTHLFGNPTVRVSGADNVRQILLGEHRLVSVQWPASVRTILGSDTLSNVHGALHKTKKKVRCN